MDRQGALPGKRVRRLALSAALLLAGWWWLRAPRDLATAPRASAKRAEATPLPAPARAPEAVDWDRPFAVPQYLVHVTGHGTVDGPVTDDYYFLYPEPPHNGELVVPDGNGGRITYAVESYSNKLRSPREVCAAAQSRGIERQSFAAWNSADSFDCSKLASRAG